MMRNVQTLSCLSAQLSLVLHKGTLERFQEDPIIQQQVQDDGPNELYPNSTIQESVSMHWIDTAIQRLRLDMKHNKIVLPSDALAFLYEPSFICLCQTPK
jgi:hypothetical protein